MLRQISISTAVLLSCLIANATGVCTATVQCSNGTASCTADAGWYGNPRTSSHVSCGLKNAGDKFLTCWGRVKGKEALEGLVCCDSNGNAVQIAGWYNDEAIDTSICQSIK